MARFEFGSRTLSLSFLFIYFVKSLNHYVLVIYFMLIVVLCLIVFMFKCLFVKSCCVRILNIFHSYLNLSFYSVS